MIVKEWVIIAFLCVFLLSTCTTFVGKVGLGNDLDNVREAFEKAAAACASPPPPSKGE